MTALPRACAPLAVALALCAATSVQAQDHADHLLLASHGQMQRPASATATESAQVRMTQADTEQADPHAHHRPAPSPTPQPLTPIPTLGAADRAAAFPPTHGHTTHDDRRHYFAALDRLESWDSDEGGAFAWEGSGWIGTDLDRLWLRSEGEHVDARIESADVEVFYGRAVARWWDAVVGVRHDFGEHPSQTFAAFGFMGLAPYMFDVEATAYVGAGGQTGLGLEAEYETLFTNRLILQSLVEAEVWRQDDVHRGIGSGLSTVEVGFRLRYEFIRKFAPYVGVAWERAYGSTADLRRASGHDAEDTRFVVGFRTWF